MTVKTSEIDIVNFNKTYELIKWIEISSFDYITSVSSDILNQFNRDYKSGIRSCLKNIDADLVFIKDTYNLSNDSKLDMKDIIELLSSQDDYSNYWSYKYYVVSLIETGYLEIVRSEDYSLTEKGFREINRQILEKLQEHIFEDLKDDPHASILDITEFAGMQFENGVWEFTDLLSRALTRQLFLNNRQNIEVSITLFGKMTMQSYELEKLKVSYESNKKEIQSKIGEFNNNLSKAEKRMDKINEVEKDVNDISDSVNKFYSNSVAIISIMVTIFSIIGFNVYSLGASPTMPSMILINLSLAFVLSLLFLLLDIVVFKKSTEIMVGVVLLISFILVSTLVFFDSNGYISTESKSDSKVELSISDETK